MKTNTLLLILNFQRARHFIALALAGGFLIFNSFAQAPAWLWANKAGGSGLEGAGGLAVDGSGNSYITGRFFSTSILFGSTTLTATGGGMYLVKYDASGNVAWAKSPGGSGDGTSIAVDGSGNSYVTGNFSSASIIFGTDTLQNASPGSPKIYIAKYDGSGNVLWARSGGGTYTGTGRGIAVDGSGNSYTTGSFRGSSVTFGSTTLANSTGFDDIFIAKFDASGNAVWAQKAGGSLDESASSIAVDGSGNSYITGSFVSSSVTFGSITLTGAGGDFFIAKYDGSGNALWAASATGGAGNDIAIDGSGNSFVCGNFYSSITFGSTTLTGAGNTDMFVAKYNSSGSAVWATGAGGTSYEGAFSIWVDSSGSIYVNGYFQSTSITLGSTTLTSVGGSDVFAAKYSSAGNVLWAKGAGGTGNDLVYGMAVDGSGNSYSIGIYYSPSIAFGSTTLTNAGNTDIFVAKLAGIVGIDEIADASILSLSPNPVTNQLTIDNGEWKIKQVEIYDVLGEKFYQERLTSNDQRLTISVADFPSGIYFVKVRGQNKERVAKFVKQ